MATYIVLFHWTEKGIENVKQSPARLDHARQVLKELGGDFKHFYLTMGSCDMIGVCEAPDDQAIAKFCLTLGARGGVRTETLPAFTEADYRKLIASLP